MGQNFSTVVGVKSDNYYKPGNAINQIWFGDVEIISRLPFGASDLAQASWSKGHWPKVPWHNFIIPMKRDTPSIEHLDPTSNHTLPAEDPGMGTKREIIVFVIAFFLLEIFAYLSYRATLHWESRKGDFENQEARRKWYALRVKKAAFFVGVGLLAILLWCVYFFNFVPSPMKWVYLGGILIMRYVNGFITALLRVLKALFVIGKDWRQARRERNVESDDALVSLMEKPLTEVVVA